jgi:hypothetical protein
MSTYDVLRGGSGAAEVHAVWDGDALPEGAPVVESSPIISDEHLAMLRRLAEDEGQDEEYVKAYVEEIKSILGVEAAFLKCDLGSAYLDETNQELVGGAEDADSVSVGLFRGSRRLFASFREVKEDNKVDNEKDDNVYFDGDDEDDADDANDN